MGHHHHHHHDAHGHHHHGADRGARSLTVALIVNAAYTALQVVVGLAAGSVALLADAGHNLSDVLALAVALGAARLATRPSTPRHSFGYRRAEILGALANALSIVAVSAVIVFEAARRLAHPPEVPGGWMMAVAAVGIAVNAASAWGIHRAGRGRTDLNLRASFLHLAGDALASVGVLVAGALVLWFGWRLADPVVAIAIGALVGFSTWSVLRDAVPVLLEAAPRGVDPETVGAALARVTGVVQVHDLHIWSVSSDFPALSAHVVVTADCDCHATRRDADAMLRDRFGITHTTLQMEHAQPRLLHVGEPGPRAHPGGP
ncbi:MAG: cation diffusion facilitator family transporter [Thermoleophilia bacterium]